MKPAGVALPRGRFGLENAFDRFVTQIESESLMPDAVAVACAEATMWACALDGLWARRRQVVLLLIDQSLDR